MTAPYLSLIQAICLAFFRLVAVYLFLSHFVLFFTDVFTHQDTFQLSHLL